MSHLQCAFEAVCKDNKKPGVFYVVLTSSHEAYGGGEEGGWWYTVSNLEAWKEYATEEAAEEAAEKVRILAKELDADAKRQHGDLCLNQMEWLEERGLEADFLPENDGETKYQVEVSDELPVFDNRRPHYE